MAISEDQRLRPVVAFDVDGVLRVNKLAPIPEGFTYLGDHRPEQEIFPAEIHLDRREYPTLYHGSPLWDENGKSVHTDYFSIPGAEFLQSLVADPQMDAVWATTWQRWANTYFAEPLGIPHLPVAVRTLEDPDANWFRGGSPVWKSTQLSRQFDGRPLVWLDDNMPEMYYEQLLPQRRVEDQALTLAYRIDPLTGITREDVAVLTHWLELASSAEGQEILRQRHREEVEAEEARIAKEREERRQRVEIFERTQSAMEELYPGQLYFNRDVGQLAGHRYGLTAENLSYAMKRHSIRGSAEELGEKIRIPGYHYAEMPPEEDESNDSEF